MGWKLGFGKKMFRFKLPSLKLGVRGSLFLAFAVIAGMAIVISVSASVMLSQLGGMMNTLSGHDIPRLAASLQLSAQSTSLSNQGQALLGSDSDAALKERTAEMQNTQHIVAEKLAEIARLGADKPVMDAMNETSKSIGDMVGSIGAAAKERLETAALRETQAAALRKAHTDFLSAATLAMLDAQTQMNAILGSANFSQTDALDAARAIDLLGNVITDSNLMASDLTAALAAPSSDVLSTLQETFEAKKKNALYKLGTMKKDDPGETIREPLLKVVALADGKTSIFKIRQKEMDTNEYGQLIVDETRKLNRGLEMSVKQLVEDVQAHTTDVANKASNQITLATMVMLALGTLTLVGSALFVWLYVGRNILGRIRNLQDVMRRLSEGDLEAEVRRSSQQDEIAVMAGSLEVFRESMIRSRTLSSEQDLDRAAKAERASRIEAQIMNFEDKVRAALDSLMTSANTMQSTAESMSTSAEHSSALVSTVASAAEETSVNVQTVSAGTEELSSSIQEIGRQVTSSTKIAANAVSEAGKTDATMQGLAENANRISSVVDLIQEIASQTNLLALNATIEAARAGEAGRGFAVVASEVKSLAEQTAKATDEIRAQISSMQNVTASAVGAIRSIGSTIGEINEVTTAIAAAVEEQGAATREIARNIQHAASGTSEVSSNIVGVSQASIEAGTAATEVLNASGELRREADTLRAEVDAFLLNIRAA
jgi:methyl-accepting chemotaxis protein